MYSCGKVQHWKKISACLLEAVLTALIWFCFQVNFPLCLSRDNYLGHDTNIVVLLPISELNVAELFQKSLYSLHVGPYVWGSQCSLLFIWQVQSYVQLSFFTCITLSTLWKTAIPLYLGGFSFSCNLSAWITNLGDNPNGKSASVPRSRLQIGCYWKVKTLQNSVFCIFIGLTSPYWWFWDLRLELTLNCALLNTTTEVIKTCIKVFSTKHLFGWRVQDLFQVQDLFDARVKIKNPGIPDQHSYELSSQWITPLFPWLGVQIWN